MQEQLNLHSMKKNMRIWPLIFMLFSSVSLQAQPVEKKLSDFFFDLYFGVDIDVLKKELEGKPDFKYYQDHNRDSRKTIVGTIKQDKNLNPVSSGNQIIVQYSSAEPKKVKKVSIKWSMNYKLEDLPSALVDFDKLKEEFKPLFSDVQEIEKLGAQSEKIYSLILKENSITVTITLIEYINFSHILSLEYRDKWKIEPVDYLKTKN